MNASAETQFQMNFPVDGDILCRHDGSITDGRLHITAHGAAPGGGEVAVNGVAATLVDGWFSAPVALGAGRQLITIRWECGGRVTEHRIGVTVNLNSRKRYRFSVDDNIEFLTDIGKDPGAYPSLFDHPFLGFWRHINEEFGTKVHINIYYQNDARDFNLTMFPDTYRGEWEANSDWLHLSFHALQNYPNRIYRDAGYDLMATHFEMVMAEIDRFAGECVYGNVTTVHWAEATVEGLRALRDRGVDTFIALPAPYGREYTTMYYLDPERAGHAATRDAWQDTAEDFTFVMCDQVVNGKALDEVVPDITRQAASPHTGEMIEFLIHEQYFRKDLPIHQPDVTEKVRRAVAWAAENGYEPCFWSEGFLGSPV